MIRAILKGIFKLVISLVSVLLTPIDSLINSAFPAIANGIFYLDLFLTYIGNLIPWILSWFHLPNAFLTLVVGYMTFKLTLPLAVHTIKLAIKWYNAIKP